MIWCCSSINSTVPQKNKFADQYILSPWQGDISNVPNTSNIFTTSTLCHNHNSQGLAYLSDALLQLIRAALCCCGLPLDCLPSGTQEMLLVLRVQNSSGMSNVQECASRIEGSREAQATSPASIAVTAGTIDACYDGRTVLTVSLLTRFGLMRQYS